MLSSSKQLRQDAWLSLKGQYWNAFAATLIFIAILTPCVLPSSIADIFTQLSITLISRGALETAEEIPFLLSNLSSAASWWAIGVVVSFLTHGPLLVGFCNYFIKNSSCKPSFAELFSGFKTRYMRNAGAFFLIYIKLSLWSLLFIIPAVIKSFEYSIVPFILADNPEISTRDAFKKAKQIMKGNKWRFFKLQLSFIGWGLLCIPTFGIGSFFLMPYLYAAFTEFYLEIKDN